MLHLYKLVIAHGKTLSCTHDSTSRMVLRCYRSSRDLIHHENTTDREGVTYSSSSVANAVVQ
jgi:hypothetical protein